MKVGYGYNRHPKDFAPYECERLYIDDSTTERQEREDMLAALGNAVMEDTLVLLQRRDIGGGQEIPRILQELADMNVTVEVIDFVPEKKRTGRPRVFDPTDEQAVKLERLWRSVMPLNHILRRASEIAGFQVKRHQMIYRFGPRWKKPTDDPLEEGE